MKNNRTLTIVLAVLTVLFAFLWLSGRKKAADQAQDSGRANTVQVERTNTVQLWHTNTIEKWRTNTVQVDHTNTVVQTVTSEVVKEVPAKLSAEEKSAGAAGVKYLNAPGLVAGAGSLYKATPIAVQAQIEAAANGIINGGSVAVKKTVEAALSSRSIPVDAKSPQQLNLGISVIWTTDVPSVALLSFRLELREAVALQRQGDIVKGPAAVWSTTSSKLVRTASGSEDLNEAVNEVVARFCDDYAKAKETTKAVESRVPAVPPVFLP
jgi:hypothetical protein